MRDVSLRELKQIFFDNDFLWFQIWWEMQKAPDVIHSPFTVSYNKQFFNGMVNLQDQLRDTSYCIMDSKVPYHSHLVALWKKLLITSKETNN